MSREKHGFRVLAPLPYASDDEKLSFDSFFISAAESSNYLSTPGFWRLALQISHNEPAVKHLALALGSLGRRYRIPHANGLQIATESALQQYGAALKNTQSVIAKASRDGNLTTALVACYLLICFDMFNGNFASAHMHLDHGLRMISYKRTQERLCSARERDDIQMISDAFVRVDLQLRGCNDDANPYPYDKFVPSFHDVELPEQFSSIEEAMRTCFALWRLMIQTLWCLWHRAKTYQVGEEPPRPASELRARCQARLSEWKRLFEDFRVKHLMTDQSDDKPLHLYFMLSAYHEMATFFASGKIDSGEMAFDTPEASKILRRILALATEVEENKKTSRNENSMPLSFEMGTITAFFSVATKSRDPELRRRAIAMLEKEDRWEGIWGSRSTAEVSRQLMEFEESKAEKITGRKVTSAADVPAEARASILRAKSDFHRRTVEIGFVVLKKSGNEGYVVKGRSVNM